MTKTRLASLVLFVAAVSLVTFSQVAKSAERVALIIAEEGYESYSPSPDGIARGEAIADQLEQLGFEIQVQIDAGDAAARAALRRFAVRAQEAKVAVVALVGHVVSTRGQPFLLPKNAQIRRSTDLLSRGISVPSVALIVARASEGGAVLVLATEADIPSTIADAVARPEHRAPPVDRVAIAYSGSPKAPVSKMNEAAAAASLRLKALSDAKRVTLADLVTAIGEEKPGQIVGAPIDIALRAPEPPKPKPEDVAAAATTAAGGAKPDAAKPDAADPAAGFTREDNPLAAALIAAAKPKADAKSDVKSDATSGAKPDVAGPKPIAGSSAPKPDASLSAAVDLDDSPAEPAAPPEPEAPPTLSVATLETLEGMLGWRQKSMLQRRLQEPGYYKGPIDGIFGPLTRQAIKDYQTEIGEDVTGFLTPTQIERLSAR